MVQMRTLSFLHVFDSLKVVLFHLFLSFAFAFVNHNLVIVIIVVSGSYNLL